jgi:hypothetical protein
MEPTRVLVGGAPSAVRGAPAAETVDLSLVMPVFNEREAIEPLLGEVGAACMGIGLSWEVVFVDDGSTRRIEVDRVPLKEIDDSPETVSGNDEVGRELVAEQRIVE